MIFDLRERALRAMTLYNEMAEHLIWNYTTLASFGPVLEPPHDLYQ